MSSSRVLPSLVALRQTLRAATISSAVSRPIPIAHASCRRLLHSSSSECNQAQVHPAASSSSTQLPESTLGNEQSEASASDSNDTLNNLHSQFEIDGEMYDMPAIDEGEGDFGEGGIPIALPNKSSIVHVQLSKLRKTPSDAAAPNSRNLLVPLSAHVFDAPARKDLIHSAVVWYLDSLRSGTASTKTRSEVKGSGRKLRPQKGSGRARLGTMSSPSLRGGAVAHGPKPRDHSTKLPRRVRELALRSMLSSKWRQGELLVVPTLDWMPPPGSTGQLARHLGSKGWDDALFLTAPREPKPSMRTLVTESRPSSTDPVYEQQQRDSHQKDIKNFISASKNLPRIEVVQLDMLTEKYVNDVAKTSEEKKRPGELHAYQILRRRKLICDLGAIEWLEEKLGGAIFHTEAGFEQLSEEARVEAEATAKKAAEKKVARAAALAQQEEANAEQLTKQQAQAESSTVPV